jgi:RNA polymerase sigma-70 factor (ECF subfamily)
MTAEPDPDTDELIRRVGRGDRSAVQQLLARHRDRLKQMVAVRMDPRLATRVDPSDAMQEVLAEASQKLSAYVRSRPLAYYPWLRQIAWQRLEHLHLRHVGAQRRSVMREARHNLALSDQSVLQLASRLVASDSSPSMYALRNELHCRVRAVLDQMSWQDRDVLLLHYLEQLTFSEVAAVLQIAEGAARIRQIRALERLRAIGKSAGRFTVMTETGPSTDSAPSISP